MRSIEAKFNNYRKDKKNENVGSIILLARVLKNNKYGRKSITNAFKKLVSKEDYSIESRKELLDWLFELSNKDKK